MDQPHIPEPASKYVAPRDEPLLYPGRRPGGDFILSEGQVWRIAYRDSSSTVAEGRVWLASESRAVPIDEFLKTRNVAPVAERYPVLAYGSNPVPGQQVSKFGDVAVVPVVFGRIRGWDAVYNLISSWGYAFAEIVPEAAEVVMTSGITFLDAQQLERMVETEANYRLAYFPDEVFLESGQLLRGSNSGLYVFAGFRKTWVPRGCEGPVPIAEVPAEGRTRIPLMQQEILSRVIDVFDLRSSGIETVETIVDRLRAEMGDDDRPGKLKFDLQQAVDNDRCSHPPLAEGLKLVHDRQSIATFGDTTAAEEMA